MNEAQRLARLGDLLVQADVPARPIAFPAARIARARRRRVVVRWRAAAAVALVGAAMLHEPLRAWVVARAQDVWRSVTGGEAAPAPAAPATAGSPTTVAFAPAAGTFTIRVAQRQAAGELAVAFGADSLATASRTATESLGEWLVRPDGVQYVNAAGARASLRVTVPRTVDRVIVVIAGGAPVVLTRDSTLRLATARP